ncbi:response regulator [Magnetovibrio sp. PR-2]|uniref:response regulator n=1 Tax=Magnetovibrio sp. PR-2 TaxID=3120356 RepID=UPI002FCE4726
MMATILLVEDNELNRDMLSRRLERLGYTINLATDGQEGVDAVRNNPPDLVLMDINMPVMDGWEAVRVLKSDPDTQRLPVIALTAHAMASDRDKAEKSGFDDYATKPVDFPALVKMIETWLNMADE